MSTEPYVFDLTDPLTKRLAESHNYIIYGANNKIEFLDRLPRRNSPQYKRIFSKHFIVIDQVTKEILTKEVMEHRRQNKNWYSKYKGCSKKRYFYNEKIKKFVCEVGKLKVNESIVFDSLDVLPESVCAASKKMFPNFKFSIHKINAKITSITKRGSDYVYTSGKRTAAYVTSDGVKRMLENETEFFVPSNPQHRINSRARVYKAGLKRGIRFKCKSMKVDGVHGIMFTRASGDNKI